MTSIFIQPARRLALRSGTRAFSLSRTSLLKPSASLRGFSTEDYNAKPKSDLEISKDILQMQMNRGILQLQVKEIRRSIFRAKVDRFRARLKRLTEMLWRHEGWVWIAGILGCFSFMVYMGERENRRMKNLLGEGVSAR